MDDNKDPLPRPAVGLDLVAGRKKLSAWVPVVVGCELEFRIERGGLVVVLWPTASGICPGALARLEFMEASVMRQFAESLFACAAAIDACSIGENERQKHGRR